MTERKLYHGTTESAWAEMQRDGKLIPSKHRMVVKCLRNGEWVSKKDDDEVCIYLTNLEKFAEQFADFRSRYANAEKGEELIFGSPYVWKWYRKEDEEREHTKGVVLEIELPAGAKLESDPRCLGVKGFMYRDAIPVECVKKVHEVKSFPLPDVPVGEEASPFGFMLQYLSQGGAR
jgi:hypothetical protein